MCIRDSDQLVIAHDVSAGCLSSSGSSALGNGADADGLAGAVGQHDSAADLLVSVTAVSYTHLDVYKRQSLMYFTQKSLFLQADLSAFPLLRSRSGR